MNRPWLGIITLSLALISAGIYKAIGQGQGDRPVTNQPNGKPCTVKAGSVYDGDTFRALCNGEEIKIRLCGIDAPEAKQDRGIEARDYLRSLLPDNAPISIVPIERDRYDRLIAEVWNDAIEGEEHINGNMVLAGMAWHYERYSGNCPNQAGLITAERLAKASKKGIWADGNAIAPWDFRRGKSQ